MISPIVKNFMMQQGFAEEADSICDMHFSGLYFQPRIMGSLVVFAILLQNPTFFFVLSAILWWNVALPKWNPFEMIYNRAIAAPRGKPLRLQGRDDSPREWRLRSCCWRGYRCWPANWLRRTFSRRF